MKPLFLLTRLLALLAIIAVNSSAKADEPKDDLARLQGTWKAVEIRSQGRTSSDKIRAKKWVFKGDKLGEEWVGFNNAYRIKLNTKATPRTIDLIPVVQGYERPELPLLCCYELNGKRLMIARGAVDGSQRAKSLDSTNDKTVENVTVFERESDETVFPEKILREFNTPKVEPTKNREADAAVREMFRAVATKAPLEKLESMVTGTNRKQLEEVLVAAPGLDSKQVDKGLGVMVLRDVRVGERIIWADGNEFVVKPSDLGPDQTYLMLTERGIEQQIVRLVRDGKRWKVDLGRFLQEQRAKSVAFQGVRYGMPEERVRELLEQYRTSRNFKTYQLVDVGEGKLVVDCDEGEGTVRYVMHFRKGILSGCEFTRPPKSKGD